jgi:hypothetical protein
MSDKKITAILFDPFRETADINEKNNTWNIKGEATKYEIFKAKAANARGQSNGENPMQKAKLTK